MARYSPLVGNGHMVAVRFSSLGDVVLTTGVLLRRHREFGTTFTFVTKKAFAPVLEGHPAVSDVVALEDAELHGQAQAMAFRSVIERWADSPLLDLHRTLRSALLAKSWKDAIICYKKMSLERRLFLWSRGRFCREKLLRYNVPQRYAIGLWSERDVPAREDLRPKIFLSQEEMLWAQEQLAPLRARYGRLAVLHPFATHPLKTWPMQTWLELAQGLRQQGIGCFWVGMGEDMPEAEKEFSWVNKTGIRQLCALIGAADAAVTADSAPMHIAAAVDTPVAALFGPTTEEWGFFPTGKSDIVLQKSLPCRPCSLHGSGKCPHAHACLAGIGAEDAAQAVQRLLAGKGEAEPRSM